MAFDFKKEYRELYQPSATPGLITVPAIPYLAVRGQGNPNEPGGAYQQAISQLYAVAYTLRMSHKGPHKIEGFFEYVVPPLEGFWWQPDTQGVEYGRKEAFHWISVLPLPDFVTKEDVAWAAAAAEQKKKLHCAAVEFLTLEEGLCVQAMHMGPFDSEPKTVAAMDQFLAEQGYENDLTARRLHHEIYLTNAQKTEASKWRTVIRHPVKKQG